MELFHIPFTVRVADIDETMDSQKSPCEEVARVSSLKALAVPSKTEDVVIAADTIVVCRGQVLGKPANPQDAARMLRLLSGEKHQVMTGLTVLRGDRRQTHTEITDIYFRHLSEEEIQAYIQTGEPMDKAGAYGIQGGAALFVSRLEGDYYNVMGLPVCRLSQILRELVPDATEDTQ
jgi:septum formation protein